ncbi:carbon monoxide dehydrogenase subunit G [Streptomyces sp. B1866]|uniref:carbon monoxide dehydrogenase subunit G n=1 Tax=Streptomyces sp. B1866 TaxID=3075431 RepID=UPI00288EBDE1|nr:carbon monoxide dehydrogenase subunit G [Streptomyces sp. B1866]MDT3399761.1 carbon monoxide dehydrogenase subunit G [Streptomyces sp. B1866]
MEHEVFVPFPVDTVRRALSESARVAACVPGLQRDADEAADPLTGRLRLRISGSTITYRGTLRLAERGGVFEVEGEGTEARGSGSVRLALTVVAKAVDGGTGLVCSGGARGKGRLAEFDSAAASLVGRRLLDRFAQALTASLVDDPPAAADAAADPGAPQAGKPSDAADTSGTGKAAKAEDAEDAKDAEDADGLDGDDTDDLADVTDLRSAAGAEPVEAEIVPDAPVPASADEPPAEAAHARRTMIGRSTEEVDHAPPRGRYAPVPAPESSPGGPLPRWAAPAAAAVIASAVVVGRALRRRR